MDSKMNDLVDEIGLGSGDDSSDYGNARDLNEAKNAESEHVADVEEAQLKKRKKASANLEKSANEKILKKDAKSKMEHQHGSEQKTKKAISEVHEKAVDKKLNKGVCSKVFVGMTSLQGPVICPSVRPK